MGSLRAGKRHGNLLRVGRGTLLHLYVYALMTKELHTRPSMNSSTPAIPEERRILNRGRMQQDAHPERLSRVAPIPLTLRTFRTRAAIANAGAIDDPQTTIDFSLWLMGNQHLTCRTSQRPIGLERKV